MEDKFENVIWKSTPTGLTARVAELTLKIVKVSTDRAISGDRKILSFSPLRYRAYVEDAPVEPGTIFFFDLQEAKAKTIDLARVIEQRISDRQARRRTELLEKLGLDEQR